MTTLRRVSLTSLIALALAPAAVHADGGATFEALAGKARRVDASGLASLFWSQTESCAGIAGDLARRQCLGVRAARRAQLAGATFVIAAPSAAVVHQGAYDAGGKKLALAIEGCVACTPAGKARLVTGKGKRALKAGALRAAAVGQASVPLASAAEAEVWKQAVLPRLRSEFVVRLPGGLDAWKAGDLAGYGVEVVGYRVWDPCDGTVLAARPPAGRGDADPSACPAPAPETATPTPAEPTGPELDERVSASDVKAALEPVRVAAQTCFERYGVPGSLTLKIAFDQTGKIIALGQTGDFVETPTAACVERAARRVVFPPSKKANTKVAFPIKLE